jgi:hypothetical protein
MKIVFKIIQLYISWWKNFDKQLQKFNVPDFHTCIYTQLSHTLFVYYLSDKALVKYLVLQFISN